MYFIYLFKIYFQPNIPNKLLVFELCRFNHIILRLVFFLVFIHCFTAIERCTDMMTLDTASFSRDVIQQIDTLTYQYWCSLSTWTMKRKSGSEDNTQLCPWCQEQRSNRQIKKHRRACEEKYLAEQERQKLAGIRKQQRSITQPESDKLAMESFWRFQAWNIFLIFML
jgi:hypothetical protein